MVPRAAVPKASEPSAKFFTSRSYSRLGSWGGVQGSTRNSVM